MSEYVCELSKYEDELIEQRERIVRCRDCKYMKALTVTGLWGDPVTAPICNGPIHGQSSIGLVISPDDFCSYGEERGSEDE